MFVTIPVGRHLVACRGDRAHEIRTLLGHPSKHEEGCPRFARFENFHHSHRVPLDAQLTSLPCFTRDHALQAVGVKPVLDVDRQRGTDGIPDAWRSCWPSQFVLQELMPAFAELPHVFRFGKRKVVGVNHIQRARLCSARPQVEQHADDQPGAFALGALNNPVKRIRMS